MTLVISSGPYGVGRPGGGCPVPPCPRGPSHGAVASVAPVAPAPRTAVEVGANPQKSQNP
ncbi:hypothetical protein [Actinomadura yumaensis]|uniref:hypothetical protein n=1 Tax=Actinomadura yumaensis TaxID=111807 RepID=UPI00366C8108